MDAVQLGAEDNGESSGLLTLLQALEASGQRESALSRSAARATLPVEARIRAGTIAEPCGGSVPHADRRRSHAKSAFARASAPPRRATGQLRFTKTARGRAGPCRGASRGGEPTGAVKELLDTIRQTATTYSTCRAKSVEGRPQANVREHAVRIFETARAREAVGLSTQSDYLRWVAQRQFPPGTAAKPTCGKATVELRRLIHDESSDTPRHGRGGNRLNPQMDPVRIPQRYLEIPENGQSFRSSY